MSELQFRYPEDWIEAIDSLIEHYKIYGQSSMSDCPLCKVALKEEKISSEAELCVCPWNYMSKRSRKRQCFEVGTRNEPKFNIRRLQGWRKRLKDMLTEGGAA